MVVRIQYQGISGSPWMREYMEGKIAKLERYISSGAIIVIDLVSESDKKSASINISTTRHEYVFHSMGEDVYEAFTSVLDEACRALRNDYLKIKEKMHRKFSDLNFTET